MKRVFKYLAFGIVGYWLLVFIVICGLIKFDIYRDCKYLLTTAIQFFGGLATFLAVIVSLFGNAIKRRYDRPNIVLKSLCDDAHCALKGMQDAMVSSLNRKTLEIFISAVNTSVVEAHDTQLVCVKAFVSEDGEKFVHFQTFRAASFRWLYSSEDNKFLTTLRHSIEKFVKVVDIIEEDIAQENVKAGERSKMLSAPMRCMHFEISLALNVDGSPSIKVDEKYKAILLSLRLASSNVTPTNYYVKIQNKLQSLDSMPSRDRLEIVFLNKEQAQNAVAVNLE